MTLHQLGIILNSMPYSTGQKERILAFFSDNREKAFTSEEIIGCVPGAVQSTVYRLLQRLAEEGLLMKVPSEHGALYRYSDPERCPHHMHMECTVCGRTCHLDEDISDRIRRAIEEETGFSVLPSTVFRGICPECRK